MAGPLILDTFPKIYPLFSASNSIRFSGKLYVKHPLYEIVRIYFVAFQLSLAMDAKITSNTI